MLDYGWNFQPVKNDCLLSGWQGEVAEFPLEIKYTKTYTRFSVKPLIELSFPNQPYAHILKYLLGINESAHFVKLNISRGGSVCLYADLLNSQLTYDSFSQMLEIIGYYADLLYVEISKEYSRTKTSSTRRYLV